MLFVTLSGGNLNWKKIVLDIDWLHQGYGLSHLVMGNPRWHALEFKILFSLSFNSLGP